jgi:hypothetical protein
MPQRLENAWGRTLDLLMGSAGFGEDAGIMASQLERAATIIDRSPTAIGNLFETEPSQFYAALDAYAPSAKASI